MQAPRHSCNHYLYTTFLATTILVSRQNLVGLKVWKATQMLQRTLWQKTGKFQSVGAYVHIHGPATDLSCGSRFIFLHACNDIFVHLLIYVQWRKQNSQSLLRYFERMKEKKNGGSNRLRRPRSAKVLILKYLLFFILRDRSFFCNTSPLMK